MVKGNCIATLLVLICAACAAVEQPVKPDPELIASRIDAFELGPHRIALRAREHHMLIDGFVESDSDRRLVEEIVAYSPGVRSVSSDLTVRNVLGRARLAELNPFERQLLTKLEEKPRLSGYVINAEMDDHGTAVITGAVAQPADRDEIERIVLRMPGVERVVNNITLTDNVDESHTLLMMQQALARNPGIDPSDITYSLNDGVLTLRGDVRTFREVDRILSIALMLPGVKDINSEITVNGRPYATESFVLD